MTAGVVVASFTLGLSALVVASSPAAATQGVDDYPSYLKTARQDSKVDPWRFYNRECTSFVAWRLNNDGGVKFTNHYLGPHWGDAAIWKAAALDSGVKVDNVPVVGAVAWWGRGSAGSSVGHVAWVLKVNSTSSITVEEYNYLRRGYYDTRTIASTSKAWPQGFIHVVDLALAATVRPSVPGTARVGTTLTAKHGTWTPSGATYSYQWYADGAYVAGATRKSFTPGAAQLGKKLQVRVTASKPGVTSAASTSVATAAVVPGVFANTALPTVSGAAQVGAPVTVSPGTWSPVGSYTYQWYADHTAIKGATGATFTPGVSQLGRALVARVTARAAGYTTRSVYTVATPAVAPGTITLLTPPVVSGVAQVGHPLTASSGAWAPGGRHAYQWLADGAPIAGATTTRFTPTPEQVGRAIAVQVTATRDGYTPHSATSAVTAPVQPGDFTHGGAPAVTGHAWVGSRLSVSPGRWSPAPAFTYQWLADGVPIGGAHASSFVPTAAEAGKAITAQVTATAAGYRTETLTSAATAPVLPRAGFAGTPRISGTARVGRTLTVVPGATTPATGRPTYQWYRGHTALRGDTAASHRVTDADRGHRLSVRLTLAPSGWAPTSAVTARTPVVQVRPRMVLRTRVHGAVVRISVRLTAPGLSAVPGDVTVLEGRRVRERMHLVRGADDGSFRVHGRGAHHLTVVYAGRPQVVAITRHHSVRVR